MTQRHISVAEQQWMHSGIAANVREDGRGRLDCRNLTVETGVLQQTNGSALVKLGGTRVLIGVKVEVGQVADHANPTHGRLQCAVDWCGSCRAAGAAVQSARQRIVQAELSATLSKRLENVLLPGKGSDGAGGLDLSQLCIVEGRECWVVFVDVLVLGDNGNLFDVMCMGARAALFNTRIPSIELVEGEDGELEIALSEDPMACKRLDVEPIPICVSLTRVGQHYIIDPSYEEELCMSAQSVVAVDKKGRFCGISKTGTGNIHSSALLSMLQSAQKIGIQLLEQLDKVLDEEEQLDVEGREANLFF